MQNCFQSNLRILPLIPACSDDSNAFKSPNWLSRAVMITEVLTYLDNANPKPLGRNDDLFTCSYIQQYTVYLNLNQ